MSLPIVLRDEVHAEFDEAFGPEWSLTMNPTQTRLVAILLPSLIGLGASAVGLRAAEPARADQPPEVMGWRLRATWHEHKSLVSALALSPDGKILASATAAEARLWDLQTGKVLHALECPSPGAPCVAFSADGKTLATGGPVRGTARASFSQVLLWDVATGKQTGQLDSKRLAMAHINGNVDVLEAATGKVLSTVGPHPWTVEAMVFARDGATLITAGGRQGEIKVWECVRFPAGPPEKKP